MEIILSVPRPAEGKIVSRGEAAERVQVWSSQGRRTVFTNGCFDLLHSGHARYLGAARKLGDALVVGINSDASIRRIKGDRRPILPENERAELIASLECVDLVVLFAEDTPEELIAALKPKILVKGADWAKENIAGKATVEALGGEVATIPLVQGRSTSTLIKTILERYANLTSPDA